MRKRILLVDSTDTLYAPLCAGVLRCMLRQKGWEDVEVRSCGVMATDGRLLSENLRWVAGEMGIDLTQTTAHRVTRELTDWADLIIPQTEAVRRGMRQYMNKDMTKIGKPRNVEGEFDRSLSALREIRAEIIAYCERLVRKLMTIKRDERKLHDQVVIRPVKTEEASLVQQLEELCFSHPWTLASIEEELAKDNGSFYGAFYEGQLLGYGSMWTVLGQASINNIAVDPQFRKMGLGNRILLALEEDARRNDGDSITLEVRSQNQIAISLYQKNGFEICGCRKGFYRDPEDDGVIMTKQLV